MLAGMSRMVSLVADMTSSKKEIYAHVGLVSCEERENNLMVRDLVSTEGVAKL
jgi:hypothetical protein